MSQDRVDLLCPEEPFREVLVFFALLFPQGILLQRKERIREPVQTRNKDAIKEIRDPDLIRDVERRERTPFVEGPGQLSIGKALDKRCSEGGRKADLVQQELEVFLLESQMIQFPQRLDFDPPGILLDLCKPTDQQQDSFFVGAKDSRRMVVLILSEEVRS